MSHCLRICFVSFVLSLIPILPINPVFQIKCEQYWPQDHVPLYFGDLIITPKSESEQADWTIREFILKHVRNMLVRYLFASAVFNICCVNVNFEYVCVFSEG